MNIKLAKLSEVQEGTMDTTSPDQSSVLGRESKFTPGPWRMHFDPPTPDYEFPYMHLKAGDGVGDGNSVGGFTLSGIISEGDARMIAAAPDMLDALERAYLYKADMPAEVREFVRAALAKATGA